MLKRLSEQGLYSGIALSLQLISIPILAHSYQVEDIAFLATLISVSVFLSNFVGLKFDILNHGLTKLTCIRLYLSLIFYLQIVLFSSLFILLFVWLIGFQGELIFTFSALLALAASLCLYNNAIAFRFRCGKYKLVGVQKISRNILYCILLAAAQQLSALGLVLAEALSRIPSFSISFFLRLRKIFKKYCFKIINDNRRRIGLLLVQSSFNSINLHIFVFVILMLGESKLIALFYLASRVLALPNALFNQSAAQLFLKNFDYQNKNIYLMKNAFLMIFIGSVLFFIIWLALQLFGSLIYGDYWYDLEWVVIALIPTYFAQFVVSPILGSYYLLGLQKLQIVLEAIKLVCVGISIWLSYYFDAGNVFQVYAFTNAGLYFALLVVLFFKNKTHV